MSAAPAAEPLLRLEHLSVRYGVIQAIDDVSLEVQRGEIVAMLGSNGAGKTTTLSAVVGLVRPSSGRITSDGADLGGLTTEAIVKRGITLVREGRRLFGRLTVDENLRLGAAALPRAERRDRRDELAELFPPIRNKFNIQAGLLSGGEQQMVAIARALMSRPRLLLLDEPSLGLAPKIQHDVFELLTSLRDHGVTMLLVEQNVERALQIADRGYVLRTGRVEMAGAAADLSAEDIEHAYLGIQTTEGQRDHG